jgi:exopolysaccharide production protein ExoQ
MPPILALGLTVGFVVYLFRRDFRDRPNVSRALWLPVMWTILISSRSLAQWLDALGVRQARGSMEEGNSVDAIIYLVLIIMGLRVLARRRISFGEVVRNNRMLTIFFVYCLLAVAWSDFPLVAFKRWTKVVGHPVMALIVLTESDPVEALTVLMRRCAFLLMPLSITLIKYFPDIGRNYDDWGMATNNGVTRNKNELGCLCMLWAFFFFWQLLKTWRTEPSAARKQELYLNLGLLLIIGYSLRKAHCATATVCLAGGALIVFAVGTKWVKPQYIGVYIVAAVAAIGLEESVFGLISSIRALLGHESTMTGRELLWQELLNFHTNPILGAGYESFWLGPRLDAIWATHWWHPTEAHNGYLETYLNLGALGVILLAGLLFSSFQKARAELMKDFEFGRFRLGLVIAFVAYNWTEAAFKGLSPVWFLFMLITIDYPSARVVPVESFQADALEEKVGSPYIGSPA